MQDAQAIKPGYPDCFQPPSEATLQKHIYTANKPSPLFEHCRSVHKNTTIAHHRNTYIREVTGHQTRTTKHILHNRHIHTIRKSHDENSSHQEDMNIHNMRTPTTKTTATTTVTACCLLIPRVILCAGSMDEEHTKADPHAIAREARSRVDKSTAITSNNKSSQPHRPQMY